ncbi:MAG: DUF11 domain-containing protein, partial [Rhodothermales bacterium]|nr:DUF11 domain-containing protein [Rhodothermales bacterium]
MNRLLFLFASFALLLATPAHAAVTNTGGSTIDLEVEKTVDIGASHFGEKKIAYKIVVLNDHDASERATWVDVKDHVPSYADVVSVDTPSGASWDPHEKEWTIEWISVGSRVELGIVLQFHSDKLPLRNCASIEDADQEDHDSTPGNFHGEPDEDDESCADATLVDLELHKTVSDENPNRGDEIVYTITLKNGDDAHSTAHDITVSEVLPAGLEVLDINPSAGTVDPETLEWFVSSLDVHESETLEITVKASPARSGSRLVPNGLYRLHDHPDGAAADPTYGLRLDELFGDHAPITFSFDREDAEVWMQVSGSTVTIYGRVFGGKDHGSSYDSSLSGYWDLFFEYDGSVAAADGDDDLLSAAGSEGASGYITPEFWSDHFDAGERFDLAGHVDNGLSFNLGDTDDGNGHRGFDGLSGWGWLEHGQYGSLERVPSSDWLFTAELHHENSYKNCVQVWEANEQDKDSGYANGFTRGEDDDACAKFELNEEIDLAILKESIGYDSDTGEAEYQVTVYNQNIGEATGVFVRDYLPADAAFTRVISTTQGSAVALSPTLIEWEVGSIPGASEPLQDQFTGPSATIVFRALIGPSLSTLNIAEISAADQIDIDSTPGNFFSAAGKTGKMAISEDDDDSADVPVVDISIDKTINSFDPVTMLAEFELSVENNSQVTATDVVVRDLLPFDAETELGSRQDLL